MIAADVVKSGVSSYASRALEAYEQADLTSPLLDVYSIIRRFGDRLKIIQDSGAVRTDDSRLMVDFLQLLNVCEHAVPAPLRPESADTCLGLSVDALASYFGITQKEMTEKLRFDELLEDRIFSRLELLKTERGPRRVFRVHYDPTSPAFSAISVMHEMYHSVQPDFEENQRILDAADSKIKLGKLIAEADKNPELEKTRNQMVLKKSHILRFCALPEIGQIAAQIGVDPQEYARFLDETIPELDFLMAYLEGDAYTKQGDIVSASTILKPYDAAARVYKLIAMASPLLSAYGKPHNEVGIGLCEYLRNHPDATQYVKNSTDFHRELSETMLA